MSIYSLESRGVRSGLVETTRRAEKVHGKLQPENAREESPACWQETGAVMQKVQISGFLGSEEEPSGSGKAEESCWQEEGAGVATIGTEAAPLKVGSRAE